MVKKHAGKKHFFLNVDEITRIPSEVLVKDYPSLLQRCLGQVTDLIDLNGSSRVNFACSSLASVPIKIMETVSGRLYQVGPFLQ
jgi:hypothetical protein